MDTLSDNLRAWTCKDWKGNTHFMGPMMKYQPDPPVPTITVQPPEFLLLQLQKDGDVTKCALPTTVRKRWLEHPVHGPEWSDLVVKFDKLMATPLIAASTDAERLMSPLARAAEPDPASAEWSGEPTTVEQMKATYTVAHTFVGRSPAVSFVAVNSTPLDGKTEEHMELLDGQEMKLFITSPSGQTTISTDSFLLAHGQASFVKAKKAEELLEKGGPAACFPLDFSTPQAFCHTSRPNVGK